MSAALKESAVTACMCGVDLPGDCQFDAGNMVGWDAPPESCLTAVLVASNGNIHRPGRIVEVASQVRPTGSSRVRPGQSSSVRPTPSGGDEHERFVPGFVPELSEGPSSWLPVRLVAAAADPPAPPEIIGLLYRFYNHLLSGESEAMKTWLALCAAAAELAAGYGVHWTDGDDVGRGAILERLRLLGAADDAIDELFAYVLPEQPLGDHIGVVLETVRERNCRLAVWDGFNPLLQLHGLDPNSGIDVERFYGLIDPVRKQGVANLITDNVVKSRDGREGGWAIGSERKRSKAEVHLGMRRLEPLVRGGKGRAKIDVHKDRPGHLTRPSLGMFVVESGDTMTWRIEPDDSRDDRGSFRPTALMSKVDWFLEKQLGEAVSRNKIEEAKLGKAEYVRAAIDCLVEEGCAEQFSGPNRARLVRRLKPFVETEESA